VTPPFLSNVTLVPSGHFQHHPFAICDLLHAGVAVDLLHIVLLYSIVPGAQLATHTLGLFGKTNNPGGHLPAILIADALAQPPTTFVKRFPGQPRQVIVPSSSSFRKKPGGHADPRLVGSNPPFAVVELPRDDTADAIDAISNITIVVANAITAISI
jgi:hypothetical protein